MIQAPCLASAHIGGRAVVHRPDVRPQSSEPVRRSIRQLAPPVYTPLFDVASTFDFVGAIQHAIGLLGAAGATPPGRSRLHQVLKVLRQAGTQRALRRPGARARRLVGEAHRTAVEFWMVSNALNPRVPLPRRLHAKLQRSYGGALDPMDRSQSSQHARDAQFELWLAAWFAMGGRVVVSAEPDLRLPVWFEWRGVAAKRVMSPGKLLRRVKEAAEQARGHTRTAFVAVSLDSYAHQRGRAAPGVPAGKRFFSSYTQLAPTEEWLRDSAPHIKILFLFGWLASWKRRAQRPRLQMSTLARATVFPSNDKERAVLANFLDELRHESGQEWARAVTRR